VYNRTRPAADVQLEEIAQGTGGLSGAEMAQFSHEAAMNSPG
jgi:hypothetical protein